jgi:cytidylate kinase
MKDVITIDGPSGAGKGTVSKLLARKMGYKYLDTGALYRAVAWKVRKEKADPDNEKELKKILDNVHITFRGERIFVDGTDTTSEIRTNEIGELSSQLSAKPTVRVGLFSIQREICLQGRVVIEGRDTGTVIFPEAENKFFLDASPEERARRRYEELKQKAEVRSQKSEGRSQKSEGRSQKAEVRRQKAEGRSQKSEITLETVMEDIKKRDSRDSSRKNSPLKKANDMIYIDSTDLSIEEVVTKILDNLN